MNHFWQKNIVIYAIALSVFVPLYSPAEGWSQDIASQDEVGIFDISVMSFPSDSTDMSKARLLIVVGNNELRFLKVDDEFIARFEITVDIFDSNDDNIGSYFLVREIVYDSYAYTIDIKKYVLESFDYNVTPGTYKFVVQMIDTDSNTTYTKEETKAIRSFRSKSVGFSDLLFAEGIVKNWSEAQNHFASFTKAVDIDYTVGFSVYVQVVSADTQAVDYTWQIINTRNDSDIVMSKTNRISFPNGPVREVILSFTGESFPRGTYILRNEARHPNGDKDTVNQKMGINWTNQPQTSYVIEDALEQMFWIIPDDDIPADSLTQEEEEEYFKAFWKKRDPTPNTERNELTEEYFMRIDYANDYFSYRDRAGWNTNRGRVYSIYGSPDRRDDTTESNVYQTTGRSVPQIIWTYYKVRKIFIFADQDRDGNYILISEEALVRN